MTSAIVIMATGYTPMLGTFDFVDSVFEGTLQEARRYCAIRNLKSRRYEYSARRVKKLLATGRAEL